MVESALDECASLLAALVDYRHRWPGESEAVDLFIALLADGDDPFVRGRVAGSGLSLLATLGRLCASRLPGKVGAGTRARRSGAG